MQGIKGQGCEGSFISIRLSWVVITYVSRQHFHKPPRSPKWETVLEVALSITPEGISAPYFYQGILKRGIPKSEFKSTHSKLETKTPSLLGSKSPIFPNLLLTHLIISPGTARPWTISFPQYFHVVLSLIPTLNQKCSQSSMKIN